MGRRSKSSTLEDWIDVVAMLPWWVGVLLAMASYLLLSGVAEQAAKQAPTTGNELATHAAKSLWSTLAWFGKFIVPAVCLVGAVASAVKASGKRTDDEPRMEAAPIESGRPNQEQIAQRDSVAEQYDVMYGQRASPKGIESIESAADVEKMLDIIEWRRFEAVVERCYQLKGFSTSTKQHGADGGVDIKLYAEDNPDDLAGVVQCKHWGKRYVGVEQLRALRGSMAEFKASQGHFVTSSTFTPDAMEFARGNQIETVDRDQLVGLVMQFKPDERGSVLKVGLTGRYDVPTCASCGTKMVKRTPKRGGQAFWGCVSFPRCRSVIRIQSTRPH